MNYVQVGIDFEKKVEKLLNKMGYDAVRTSASHDEGIDIIIKSHSPIEKGIYLVQCKDYSSTVGVDVVRDLFGAVMDKRANKGILIANSEISDEARRFAEGKPIELIDRFALQELEDKYMPEIKDSDLADENDAFLEWIGEEKKDEDVEELKEYYDLVMDMNEYRVPQIISAYQRWQDDDYSFDEALFFFLTCFDEATRLHFSIQKDYDRFAVPIILALGGAFFIDSASKMGNNKSHHLKWLVGMWLVAKARFLRGEIDSAKSAYESVFKFWYILQDGDGLQDLLHAILFDYASMYAILDEKKQTYSIMSQYRHLFDNDESREMWDKPTFRLHSIDIKSFVEYYLHDDDKNSYDLSDINFSDYKSYKMLRNPYADEIQLFCDGIHGAVYAIDIKKEEK